MDCLSHLSPLEIIRAALVKSALDANDENEAAPRPCPDFAAYLAEQIPALRAAPDLAALASLHYVQSAACAALF